MKRPDERLSQTEPDRQYTGEILSSMRWIHDDHCQHCCEAAMHIAGNCFVAVLTKIYRITAYSQHI
jgi:hypothetical protein